MGTILGIAVTVLIASDMTVNGWILRLLIILGCLIARYLKLDRKVISLVGLTILVCFCIPKNKTLCS